MEHITMSNKEREQLIVFNRIEKGEITRQEAALQLEMSERGVRKKFKRYKSDGASGLVHKSRNRASPRRWCEKERALAIDLLRSDWYGFGPKFTSEKLLELKGITISKETLRKAMIAGGVWQAKQLKSKYRQRRPRRPMIGVMIQLDGSPHDWFEERGPKCTLLVFIDDATSQLLWLEFVPSESADAVVRATKNYIKAYGRPQSMYVDYGSVFSVNTNNSDRQKITQWERMMRELGIEVIHARTPQAKGRVERANKTLQDRLVKELRLAGVNSIEAVNQFLHETGYLAKHNRLFAVIPAQFGNAHRTTVGYDLKAIFRFKDERILANDYTITFNKRIFQLNKKQTILIRPKSSITVMTDLDRCIYLSVYKTQLEYQEIAERPTPKKMSISIATKPSQPQKVHKNSRLWARGKLPPPMESRMKSALPAVEAEKRNFSLCH
jgi:hypothetical protein